MSLSDSANPSSSPSDLTQTVPPKSGIPPWLRAWWPAIVWAVVISIFSTDPFSSAHTSRVIEPIFHWLFPSMTRFELEHANHIIRKCAHFFEYFVFCMLLYHGIRATRRDARAWHWSWALVCWLIAAVYSLFDEFHQTFVPSRGPSLRDSLIDSTAAFVALVVLYFFYRSRGRSE